MSLKTVLVCDDEREDQNLPARPTSSLMGQLVRQRQASEVARTKPESTGVAGGQQATGVGGGRTAGPPPGSSAKSDDRMIQELIAEERSLTLLDTVPSSQAATSIKSLLPELVWIDFHQRPVRGLSLLAQLRESCPEVSFLVSYHELDPELMRTAYRLGACDFLDPLSWKSDLAASIKRIEARRALRASASASPKVSPAPSQKPRPLTTLLVCDAGNQKSHTIEALIKGRKQLQYSATVSTNKALERARLLSPKLIWIELSPDPEQALSLIADLKTQSPQANIFVSYDTPDAKLIRASYRLGASDFLDPERWKTDLGAAIQRIQPQQKQAAAPILFIIVLSVLLALAWWFFQR